MPGGVIVGDSRSVVVGLRSMCDVNCSSTVTSHRLLHLEGLSSRGQLKLGSQVEDMVNVAHFFVCGSYRPPATSRPPFFVWERVILRGLA